MVVRRLETEGVERAGAGLAGDAARLYGELSLASSCDPSKPTGIALSLLLSGAAHAVATQSRQQRVELVWSGPNTVSSTLRSTEPALLELIESARQSIYLVTFAAYKVPAVADALAAAERRGVRVVCILESDEGNGGKLDFDPLPHLRASGLRRAEVYIWPQERRVRDERGRFGSLHAKFAISDRTRLLVSSANLTQFAFNLNIELGVTVIGGRAPADAANQVDELIRTRVLLPATAGSPNC